MNQKRRTYNVERIKGKAAGLKPAVIRYTNPILLRQNGAL